MAALARTAPILAALLLMLHCIGAAKAAAAGGSCDDVSSNVTTYCLGFLTNNDEKLPNKSCCSNLTSVLKTEPSCICSITSSAFHTSSYYIKRANTLLNNCNLNAYFNNYTCNVSVPVSSPKNSTTPSKGSSSRSGAVASLPSMLFLSAIAGSILSILLDLVYAFFF